MTIEFEEVEEFSRELKRLSKKYNSIYNDLNTFKKALTAVFPEYPPGIPKISNLGKNVKTPIFKVKKFRCRVLKGCGVRSGIRIIFADNGAKITFLEIYHKNKKENLDRIYRIDRILVDIPSCKSCL